LNIKDGQENLQSFLGENWKCFRVSPSDLMLSLFLDFLTKQALTDSQEIEVYTASIAAEDQELIAGVPLDDD
jgi:hypothetical protein